jgi:hypothetical protein
LHVFSSTGGDCPGWDGHRYGSICARPESTSESGETKFRALIKEGVFPEGTDVGGKLMGDRRELDRRMERLIRKTKRSAGGKQLSNPSAQSGIKQRNPKPQKPR